MVPASAPERRHFARQLMREASLELARLRRVRGAYRKTWRRIARARAQLAFAAALLAAPLAEPALAATPLFRVGFRFHAILFLFADYPDPTFADIDGDGDADLIVGDLDGNTMLVENIGTPDEPVFGPFSFNPFGLAPVSHGLTSPAFADIDGDGDLDAFIGVPYTQSEATGRTIFFRNTGTATAPAFASPSTNPFGLADVGDARPPAAYGATPEFADTDGDGDLDAFIGIDDGIVFFANTGTATAPAFVPPVTNPFGLVDVTTDHSINSPAFADIDGDGDLDLFVGAGLDVGTVFFENTGTATAPAFAAPVTNPFGLLDVGYYQFPAFSDVDGDGDLDAVIGAYAAEFGALEAFDNTGTASAPAFAPSPASPADLGVAAPYAATAFGDIDGDGDLDALGGQESGGIFFFPNRGTASAPSFPLFASSPPFGLVVVGSFTSPDLTDIDADGDLDAFVGTNAGHTFFFENTGTASAPAFAAPSANPFGLADVGFYASPDFADLDGDGDLDALIGRGDGRTVFFRNTGTASAPAFAPPSTSPFGLADVGLRAAPAFADVDGDGDLDALIGADTGNTIFFANTGTATAPAFAAPSTNPFGLADVGAFASPDLADLDGDGDLEAFIGSSNARVLLFENVLLDPEACTDGLDNDSDGLIDLANDPGCASAADTSELSLLQCDNGLDDDGDGKIDWRGDGSGDPQCMGPRADREAPPPPSSGCGLGPELLLVAPLLWVRRRIQRVGDG